MIEKALEKFSITQKWLDFNIISESKLLFKYKDYMKEEIEHNLEHYRTYFIYKYIDSLDFISQEVLENIILIIAPLYSDEKDGVYSSLLNSDLKLSDSSFEYLVSYIENKLELDFSKRIFKAKLKRMLLKEPENDLVIKKCIREGNKELHLNLLEKNLSIENLKLLSEIAILDK